MKTTYLTLIPALLALAGCERAASPPVEEAPLTQWIDTEVTLYFKRDALGAAGSPIAPTTTWMNNTKVSLNGRITAAREDGIFFDSHYKVNSGDTDLRHSVFWIPADSILAVEKKQ